MQTHHDLTEAERELVSLIRGAESFTLTIARSSERWSISTAAHDARGSGNTKGKGETFADAWRRQAPPWARKLEG